MVKLLLMILLFVAILIFLEIGLLLALFLIGWMKTDRRERGERQRDNTETQN